MIIGYAGSAVSRFREVLERGTARTAVKNEEKKEIVKRKSDRQKDHWDAKIFVRTVEKLMLLIAVPKNIVPTASQLCIKKSINSKGQNIIANIITRKKSALKEVRKGVNDIQRLKIR